MCLLSVRVRVSTPDACEWQLCVYAAREDIPIQAGLCVREFCVGINLHCSQAWLGEPRHRALPSWSWARASSSGRREPANQAEGAKSDSNREHERHRRKTVLGSVSLSHSRTDAHASQMARGERVQTHASLSTLPDRDRD
jgi:hypothetical protein